MRRLAILAAAAAAPTLTLAVEPPLQGAALVHALQQGGYVLVIRHAHAPADPPARAQADIGNPNGERQLDAAGRSSAQAMGRAFKSLRLPVGEVWSSPTYRALETARLAGLPRPRVAPELGDQGHSMQAASGDAGAWLRTRAAQPPRAGTDTVIVTQLPNISAAFGAQAEGLGDGGTLVVSPQPGRPARIVGRIAVEQWPALAAR